MGSTDFSTVSYGKNAREAFTRAVKEAERIHGIDGYTGTIAEKDYFVVIPKSEYKNKNAVKYAQQLKEKGDYRVRHKWGPAGAIQLTGNTLKEAKEFLGIKGKKNIQVWYFFGRASE